jgi:hypothetical protein
MAKSTRRSPIPHSRRDWPILAHRGFPVRAPKFKALIAADTAKWAKVVQFANIKAE